MDPMTMMAIGGGVQVAGGLIGSFLGGAQDKKALEYRKAALAQYMGVSLPELENLIAREQGATEMKGVTRDAGQEAHADETQARLAQRARDGGWDAQARESYAEGEQQAATYERGQREALASRYAPGTGAEVVLQAQAQQSGADRARMAGLGAAGDAEARAMDAILQGGAMATQRSAQHWDQDAQVAAAQDRINEFNTASANNFTLARADQQQQQFRNKLSLADAKAGALGDMAGHYDKQGQQARATAGGLGQAAGYGLSAYGMYGATRAPAAAPAAPTAAAGAALPQGYVPQGLNPTRRKVG